MGSSAYDTITALLPQLTAPERAKILERLKALGSLAPVATPASVAVGAEPSEDIVVEETLHAICRVVLSANGELVKPSTLRRAQQFSSLRDKATALGAFLRKNTANRTERRSLLFIAVRLLYDVIQDEGTPASSRTLMAQVHRLPSVLDAAFPGYAACGQLGMVVRALVPRDSKDVRT